MKKTLFWLLVVIIVLGIAWYLIYGMGKTPTAQAPTRTSNQTPVSQSPEQTSNQMPSAQAPATPQPILYMSSSKALGSFMIASNKMTLYTFKNDSSGVSTCYDACASNWPPYIVSPETGLMADNGISGNLGTITRTDGNMQLTYNGVPLYFWHNDIKPGDTNGNGIAGLWYVAKP